ncbi:MAG: MFS transporter [Cytophagales bacterium]|nr:MFS transporter [Rhizobacter sp.]
MTLPARTAALMFLSFAFAYFPSALVRGVVATLAPAFSAELNLSAANLGLLAGAYFLGFAAMQLPLGSALDRVGPKRVLLVFLAVAVVGCSAFALARSFAALTLARALIGMGVGACLMAPMTSFRRNFAPTAQMRANSWMLMTGSLGLVASTLPVQWLLPTLGWRGLFWGLALLFVLAMVLIARVVPADSPMAAPSLIPAGGYAEVFRHPTFVRYLPMAFFQYGSMVALQSLWVGPWLTRVCGWSAQQTAGGLFAINLAMLLTFMGWGVAVPRLYARGWTAHGLIAWGMPLSLVALFLGVALGEGATAWVWALFCVSSTFVSLSQPAIGQAFPASLAGRALSAYNLVIFAGVFVLQWSIGAVVDALMASGWSTVSAFRGAFALMGVCSALSYVWFLWRDERSPTRTVTVHPR